MEKTNKSINKINKQFSCKYYFASVLFILLYSCTETNLPESKNNSKDIQKTPNISLSNDSVFLSPSWLNYNIKDIGSIADSYIKAGKYNEAIELLLSAESFLLKTSNDKLNSYLWTIYDNLWMVYNYTKNIELSLEYHQKAIEIDRLDFNPKKLLIRLNNLSTAYLNNAKYDEAIPLLKEAYLLLKDNPETLWKDIYLVYLISINLANSYVWNWDFISAKKYFLEAKNVIKSNKFGFYEIWSILTSEADFAIYERDYEKAFALYQESLELYNKNWDIDWEAWVLNSMKKLAHDLENYDLAFDYQAKEFEINQKILSKENEGERAEIETKHWVEKKEIEIAKKESELEVQKQKNTFAWSGVAGALLLALGTTWFSYKLKKKNKTIEKQKEVLWEQNQELGIANNQIQEQNQKLEQANEEKKAINEELLEKNTSLQKANEEISEQQVELNTAYEELTATNDSLKETNDKLENANVKLAKANDNINASIAYASKIQKAILYNDIQEHFPKSFVFYRSKDVIGWDFYFSAKSSSGESILAVADCTGHGVPWALLTVLGKSNIKEIVEKVDNPNEIIDYLDVSFNEYQKETRPIDGYMWDSMDVACVFYNPDTKILKYSSALRPFFIVRKNYKWDMIQNDSSKDKMFQFENWVNLEQIGALSRAEVWSWSKPEGFDWYKTKEIQLFEWDEVFLFTDGMNDQFNFEDKKIKLPLFRQIISNITSIPMAERAMFVQRTYEKLMRKENGEMIEQVDDMCLVGFRV